MEAFSKISKFAQLLKQNLGVEDDDVIDSAMHNMLVNYSQGETCREKEDIKKSSFSNRHNEYQKASQTKMINIQQDQMTKEKSLIQDRPKINKKSKEITGNHVPIYMRVDDILKKKDDDLRSKKIAEEKKKRELEEIECTFKPKTGNKIQRNPAELVEHTYHWQKKKQMDRENIAKMMQEEIESNKQDKPKILKKSQILAGNRSTTPIHERLYDLRKKDENLILHLNRSVTPTRKTHQKIPNKKEVLKENISITKSSHLDFSFDNHQTKIDSSFINEVKFTPNLGFLLKGLR